jgi:hypothetical protein
VYVLRSFAWLLHVDAIGCVNCDSCGLCVNCVFAARAARLRSSASLRRIRMLIWIRLASLHYLRSLRLHTCCGLLQLRSSRCCDLQATWLRLRAAVFRLRATVAVFLRSSAIPGARWRRISCTVFASRVACGLQCYVFHGLRAATSLRATSSAARCDVRQRRVRRCSVLRAAAAV